MYGGLFYSEHSTQRKSNRSQNVQEQKEEAEEEEETPTAADRDTDATAKGTRPGKGGEYALFRLYLHYHHPKFRLALKTSD